MISENNNVIGHQGRRRQVVRHLPPVSNLSKIEFSPAATSGVPESHVSIKTCITLQCYLSTHAACLSFLDNLVKRDDFFKPKLDFYILIHIQNPKPSQERLIKRKGNDFLYIICLGYQGKPHGEDDTKEVETKVVRGIKTVVGLPSQGQISLTSREKKINQE